MKVLCHFPGAAVTNSHHLGGLKHQGFILSQFWAPGVPNKDVSSAVLPPKVRGVRGNPSLPVHLLAPGAPWLVATMLHSDSFFTGLVLCIHVSNPPLPFSYKTPVMDTDRSLDLGPALNPGWDSMVRSLTNSVYKDSYFQISHIPRVQVTMN